MTEFSTNGAGAHVASSLGMSWGGHPTEGADVLRALRADVVGGPALKTLYHGRCGGGGVGNVNGVDARTSSHNHLQSSRLLRVA